MKDRDEATLARRLLEANKALAEAIRDAKNLAGMVDVERKAEQEQQRRAEQALLTGDEEGARTALEAKRRRAKERERHQQLVARQQQQIARHRVAAAALREELAMDRERPEIQALEPERAFRRAAWLRLVGTLPERALAKAATPLPGDEYALREQLRDMLRIGTELERACTIQRARVARRRSLLEEAQAETDSWKKRAALALRAGDDNSAKAFLGRHRTWLGRAAERGEQLSEVQAALELYERAAVALAEALAQARRDVPHVLAGLGH